MHDKTNLAGRAGRWSAAHWKTATFGWFAFAIAAVVVGGARRCQGAEGLRTANGESARAERILEQAATSRRRRPRACSSSRGRRRSTRRPSARPSASVVQTLSGQRTSRTSSRRSRTRSGPGLGATGTPRSSSSTSRATPTTRRTRSRRSSRRSTGAGRKPELIVEEFGERLGEPRARRAVREGPERGRAHVAAADDRDPARSPSARSSPPGCRCCSRSRRCSRRRAQQLAQPRRADRRADVEPVILMIGMAVGIDYSLFYLRREREERRAGRAPHDALLRTAARRGRRC